MRVVDLTQTISPEMPVYPGTETPNFVSANTYEKDGFKETKISFYTHTGTHVDPPVHLFANRTAAALYNQNFLHPYLSPFYDNIWMVPKPVLVHLVFSLVNMIAQLCICFPSFCFRQYR